MSPSFHRVFHSRTLRPKMLLQGSVIAWFSVSAAWEQEGMKLTAADLKRLETASGRFVKLPDSGWVELDRDALMEAKASFADFGMEQLAAQPQRISLLHAAHLSDDLLAARFSAQTQLKALQERLANFKSVPPTPLPPGVRAELRPYQKDGFDFLCYLGQLKLGGI